MAELALNALAPSGDADQALVELLLALKARGYRFTTVTPATHARVLARPGKARARSLRDVLGWSLPFEAGAIPPEILALLDRAGALRRTAGGLRSALRASSLGGLLLLHSAYPTDAEDAVFFGPDSYRFADFVRAELSGGPPVRCLADLGAGAGAGALAAALDRPGARLLLTDINPEALRLARVNAQAAGIAVETFAEDGLAGSPCRIDTVIANPPYLLDGQGRDYRDGGSLHGAETSLEMARHALDILQPGGRLLLYSGSAIVEGRDALQAELAALARGRGAALRYRELDPDVFGEELALPAYADVERIAVIGAVVTMPG